MHYKITHTTTYSYSEAVSICHNEVHLTPREMPRQKCLVHRLTIRPNPAVSDQQADYFGNQVTFFTIQQTHRKLVISALSRVEVLPTATPDPLATPAWEVVTQGLKKDLSPSGLDVFQYSHASPQIPVSSVLADYARQSFTPGRPILSALLDLNARIHRDFKYDPTATTVSTPLLEVFRLRRGVCQDFAHLGIGCLRSLGLPARYVSGYLRTNPPPGKARLVGADASHAWLSAYMPGVGWIDIDPTNNSIPQTDHLTLAWGRDYGDVCPVQGVVLGGGNHSMHVAVDVEPLDDNRGSVD